MPAVSLVEAQTLGEKIPYGPQCGQGNATLTIAPLLRAEMEGLPSHGFSRYSLLRGPVGCWQGGWPCRAAGGTPKARRCDCGCPLWFCFQRVCRWSARQRGLPRNRAWPCWPCATRTMRCAGFSCGRPCRAGLVALGFANSPASLAPTVAKGDIWHQPAGHGLPAQGCAAAGDRPFHGLAGRGKILQAAKKGELIPEGAAVDAQGNPTRDPAKVTDGAPAALLAAPRVTHWP